MSDDHHNLTCEDCGATPRLVRLGAERPAEHASFGIECECVQSDGETPVGTFAELNQLPDAWEVRDE